MLNDEADLRDGDSWARALAQRATSDLSEARLSVTGNSRRGSHTEVMWGEDVLTGTFSGCAPRRIANVLPDRAKASPWDQILHHLCGRL